MKLRPSLIITGEGLKPPPYKEKRMKIDLKGITPELLKEISTNPTNTEAPDEIPSTLEERLILALEEGNHSGLHIALKELIFEALNGEPTKPEIINILENSTEDYPLIPLALKVFRGEYNPELPWEILNYKFSSSLIPLTLGDSEAELLLKSVIAPYPLTPTEDEKKLSLLDSLLDNL